MSVCNRLVFNEYFCNILEMLYRLCHRYIIVVDFFFKVQAISRFNATSTKKFLEILIEYQSDMKYHPEFQNVDSGYGAITADASLVRLYNAKVRHSQTQKSASYSYVAAAAAYDDLPNFQNVY